MLRAAILDGTDWLPEAQQLLEEMADRDDEIADLVPARAAVSEQAGAMGGSYRLYVK